MNFASSSRRNPVRQRALTIVEVMIAVMITGIVFVTIYLGFVQGFAIIRMTQENLRATQILQEHTELIRLYTWEQITNTGGIIPGSKVDYFYPSGEQNPGIEYITDITISPASVAGVTESYANDMRLVTFQVRWTSGNILHTNSISTLVSYHGLHNYWF